MLRQCRHYSLRSRFLIYSITTWISWERFTIFSSTMGSNLDVIKFIVNINKDEKREKEVRGFVSSWHMNTANRSTPEFIPSRHSENNLYKTVSNCDIIICTAGNLFSALYKNLSLLSSLNASQLLLLLLLTRHCAKPNWNLVCDSTNPLFQIWASSKRTWNWNRLISESD